MITETLPGEHGAVKRTVLPNGVRVVSETMPWLQSETVGIWVDSGSRDETPLTAGSTHFLEHMLFKGTRSHDARQIAEAFDRTGGESNAATSKEYTCYYSRTPVSDLPQVVDLLWEMVLDSQLDPAEFERERGVIIEEIAMDADDPTDVLFETFDSVVYADHPLGRPIGATKDQIARLEHSVLLDHYAHAYVGPRLTFAAAGGAAHEALVEQVLAATSALPPVETDARTTGADLGRTAPVFHGGVHHVHRATEQQGIVIGMPGLPDGDEDRYTFSVLYSLLGGGMSSRLFQTVREEHGLAYNVHAIGSRYQDVGQFGVYAGCSPDKAQAVIDLCVAELERLATERPGENEVADVISQAAGSTLLGLESSAARMNRLARWEMSGREYETPEQALARVREVTAQDVSDLAARLCSGTRALVTLGPAEGLHLPG
ncbi:M16 family metallopeptidase [Brevibacterium litoralis]|uniref:M16 family metallopeptidase n=1 Tax=Brevibacterium litoralis TaxID=3138935 RepID=UPI0032EF17C7